MDKKKYILTYELKGGATLIVGLTEDQAFSFIPVQTNPTTDVIVMDSSEDVKELLKQLGEHIGEEELSRMRKDGAFRCVKAEIEEEGDHKVGTINKIDLSQLN